MIHGAYPTKIALHVIWTKPITKLN